MPAVFFSASFSVSRLRSSISFSVTTVSDCGMSRSSCWPLPMREVVACTPSLPWRSALPVALMTGITVSAFGASAGAVCAEARPARPKPAASAPSGKSARLRGLSGWTCSWGCAPAARSVGRMARPDSAVHTAGSARPVGWGKGSSPACAGAQRGSGSLTKPMRVSPALRGVGQGFGHRAVGHGLVGAQVQFRQRLRLAGLGESLGGLRARDRSSPL
jgi:hypothetical protein